MKDVVIRRTSRLTAHKQRIPLALSNMIPWSRYDKNSAMTEKLGLPFLEVLVTAHSALAQT